MLPGALPLNGDSTANSFSPSADRDKLAPSMTHRLFLIDGSSYFYRAFFDLGSPLFLAQIKSFAAIHLTGCSGPRNGPRSRKLQSSSAFAQGC